MPHSPLEGTFIFACRQFGLKIFCFVLTGIQMIFDIATHKTFNRKIFSSSMPYIWLQCCSSFAAGLQPHPGSRGCSNTCVFLYFVFWALSPFWVTHVQMLFIFSCYKFSALHSEIKTGKKKSDHNEITSVQTQVRSQIQLCACAHGSFKEETGQFVLWIHRSLNKKV